MRRDPVGSAIAVASSVRALRHCRLVSGSAGPRCCAWRRSLPQAVVMMPTSMPLVSFPSISMTWPSRPPRQSWLKRSSDGRRSASMTVCTSVDLGYHLAAHLRAMSSTGPVASSSHPVHAARLSATTSMPDSACTSSNAPRLPGAEPTAAPSPDCAGRHRCRCGPGRTQATMWRLRRGVVAHSNGLVTGSVNEGESRHAADDSQDSGSASL